MSLKDAVENTYEGYVLTPWSLCRTVLAFVYTPINERGVFLAIWFFIVIFVGSTVIGGLVGMLSALLFRYGGFSEKG